MKRLIAYLQAIDHAWLITWTLIYLGFVILDAFFANFWGVTVLKMLGIILCVVYAWQKFRDDSLLILALGFTLLADTILALNHTSIAGVFTFCFAQFFHTARLKKTAPNFLFFYFAIIFIFFLLSILLSIPPMYPLAAIYGTTLIINLTLSAKWHHKSDSVPATCAMYGFILFLLCDLCVGLSYLSVTKVIPFFIHRLADYFAWVFYYPSQVLISNSSTKSDPNFRQFSSHKLRAHSLRPGSSHSSSLRHNSRKNSKKNPASKSQSRKKVVKHS